jgi:hypothetical protein
MGAGGEGDAGILPSPWSFGKQLILKKEVNIPKNNFVSKKSSILNDLGLSVKMFLNS